MAGTFPTDKKDAVTSRVLSVFPGAAGEVGIGDVLARLRKGDRVLLLVRHAERPKIDFDDRTFGGSLPLTPEGERMSETFGRILRGAADDVQFAASPLLRTVMTARLVAKGMGLEGAEILEDSRIGNDSAFVRSQLEMWETFRDGLFFDRMFEYMATGRQHGFNALGPATEAFEDYVLSRFTARLGIFATHDNFIASFLHGTGGKTDFDHDNWPRFLDSAAIVVSPSGTRSYALVRAGLSDRICGV